MSASIAIYPNTWETKNQQSNHKFRARTNCYSEFNTSNIWNSKLDQERPFTVETNSFSLSNTITLDTMTKTMDSFSDPHSYTVIPNSIVGFDEPLLTPVIGKFKFDFCIIFLLLYCARIISI